MSRDRDLIIGDKVRLTSTGEVGVVVWTWQSKEADFTDTYIAFFGTEFPAGAPQRIPYILRYSAGAGLELVDP